MEIEEFKKKFQELKNRGFIKSLRKGPTGIGYTFERLLGLNENNLALPDIKNVEIKTHRENSNSMITLFTFNKRVWKINPLEAIKKYGSYDNNGRLGMYYTMSLTPNSAGLFLTVNHEQISIQHSSGEVIAAWQLSVLEKRFLEKIPMLLFISAHTEERDSIEYFHFYRGQLMSGTSQELLSELFKTGNLLVDVRLHDKKTMARNHGTGFRTYVVYQNRGHIVMALPKKYIDSTWDYQNANTKKGTHCYHNYPAMMIPQIANRLITEYGQHAKVLFDPYCGTGTSLVEATIKGMNAYGTDLNPLARLITEAKTAKIELQILDLYLKELNDYLFTIQFGIVTSNILAPDFKNIDFWFKKDTKDKLTLLKQFIDKIKDEKIKKFFLVAFSETVRESSLTRNGEFKLYRMPEKQREQFSPDVFGIMQSKLARNRSGLKDYLEMVGKNDTKIGVYDFNSSDDISAIKEASIDIVVTSPPYGDSRTTVAYGQFSRLTNQWLGVENASQVDHRLMGGKHRKIAKMGVDAIDQTIEKIARKNEKRATDIFSFYYDYSRSIANVSAVVKKNGHSCYVVGNRRVKDITLPTDKITQSLFEAHGFRHKNTFIRRIPNKRMPSKNSPTNKTGEKAVTMNNEFIVIMQKQ